MHDVDCLNCDSDRVRVMTTFGRTVLYTCEDCGFKFSDSDIEFEEELQSSKRHTRWSEYDDDDDEVY